MAKWPYIGHCTKHIFRVSVRQTSLISPWSIGPFGACDSLTTESYGMPYYLAIRTCDLCHHRPILECHAGHISRNVWFISTKQCTMHAINYCPVGIYYTVVARGHGFAFNCVISKFIVVIISNSIVFRWMAQDLTIDKSTLVQVRAWCLRPTRHYLK